MNSQLPLNLDKIIQNVSKVRLKGGLAGKICYVLIFVALAIAAVSWSVKNLWISWVALLMIFILTFIFLWRLMNLANRNPQSALMEGAELLAHEQLMFGTKKHPEIVVSPAEFTASSPIKLSQSEEEQVNNPDQQDAKQLESGSSNDS